MTADPAPRWIDGGDLGALVDSEPNLDALRYLAEHQPSCHSDTGEALMRAAGRCGECVAYSPSFRQCRYVALVTNRRIFALGLGQCSVCYRLPEKLYTVALQTGAISAEHIGAGWVQFDLFRPGWPAPDLPFWTLEAYAAARKGAS
jgi:hypothetical protein